MPIPDLAALAPLPGYAFAQSSDAEPAPLCAGGGYNPIPTSVAVQAVPIVVQSTVDEYFVLYVLHDLGHTVVQVPVLVALGQNGTTTLTENIEMLPTERYAVEKYLIADPADIDGDCTDDITELGDPVGMSPLTKNPLNTPSIDLIDGSMTIPDQETFGTLTKEGYIKFYITGINTGNPQLYFINANTHRDHYTFFDAVDLGVISNWEIRSVISFDPDAVAPDGSLGVYYYELLPHRTWPFSVADITNTMLAAAIPIIDNNLAYFVPIELMRIPPISAGAGRCSNQILQA